MESTGIQQLFFQHIKAALPGHISLAEDIADALNISNDSAYRRIRGEKQMSFEEIKMLCAKYKVSLDQFLHLQTDTYIFSGKLNSNSANSFSDYLENVEQNFLYFNSFAKKHIYILMKDIPPFVYFPIPELATFKYYFWMKSILDHPDMKGVKFSFDDPRYVQFNAAAARIIDLYNNVPMTEIWNIESVNSTLRQINFYYESGCFQNKADVMLLYTKTSDLIDHLEKQAEAGKKFRIGTEPKSNAPEYKLFVNELILGDNTYMAELDEKRLTFLNHSVLYFVATADERFNASMFANLQNLIKKSTPLSTFGEKERVKFFNQIRTAIKDRQLEIK